eukprot:15444533-Alexandrium_andersonii.AAC.1
MVLRPPPSAPGLAGSRSPRARALGASVRRGPRACDGTPEPAGLQLVGVDRLEKVGPRARRPAADMVRVRSRALLAPAQLVWRWLVARPPGGMV